MALSKGVKNLGGLILGCALVALPIAWFFARPPERPLPDLYPMPAFALTSEKGTPFASARLEGKVVVANFIFTSCPTVCPVLTAHMASIQKRLADREGVQLVSFSVDPANDTPEVLAEYGRKFGQDPARWTFLTGELPAVKQAVEQGFKVMMGVKETPDGFDIVHGEHFVLVDKKGRIRGFYRADKLDELAEDVDRLLTE